MKESTVYVYRTSPKTLESDIEKVLNTSDFQELNSEKEIIIKINANYDRDWPGCNTSKWFLDALLKNLRRKGFDDLKVIEGDLKLQPAVKTIKAIGIDKILRKYEVPFLPIENLPRNDELPMIFKNSQLISTPVLHTHTFAVISVAAKNLFGLLPIYREKYHNILSKKILEIVKNIKVFSIVDGTVGLEGGSMRLGSPVKTDLILAGWDPIGIDLVAAKIMGISLDKIPYLDLAMKKGLVNSVTVGGDFLKGNLPQYSFSYKNSVLTDLLCNLDSQLRGNRIMGCLFRYNSLFDRFGNRTRRMYTGCVYYKKKKKILEGDWKVYESEYVKG